ncbi:cytidine deaminase [Alsobacter sp. SYSU M60028]|uniref:Cytidine deaminase n=1 Tax=Alsobacter ponti TaxID=2962936 RepID=A0ABT1LAW2_9HYPH|nr:cytidine deaminase [Alsobacter ponti]MCP8938093.1 cytidine deaminase [Alsobacter ponti]
MSEQDAPADLVEAATLVRDRAYAPYSRYKVGAALRAASGRVYAGANVENAAYPVGVCAEASAISAMVAGGDTRLVEIAVVAEGGALVTPCGGCRQRIFEFGGAKAVIWAADLRGRRRRFTADELLPLAFGPDSMAASETAPS